MSFVKRVLLVAIVSAVGWPVVADARKVSSTSVGGQANCHMVKNAQMGISFSNVAVELASAQSYVDDQVAQVMSIAADIGIEDIFIQNMNYNLYSNNGGSRNAQSGTQYLMNGNISFQVSDAEKAVSLMEKVGGNGYNVTFNMNSYRQCQ